MLNTKDGANGSWYGFLEDTRRIEDVIPPPQSGRYPEPAGFIPRHGHWTAKVSRTLSWTAETPYEPALAAEDDNAVGRVLQDEDLTVRSDGYAVVSRSREVLVRPSPDIAHPEFPDNPPLIGLPPQTGGSVLDHYHTADGIHLRQYLRTLFTGAGSGQTCKHRSGKVRRETSRSDAQAIRPHQRRRLAPGCSVARSRHTDRGLVAPPHSRECRKDEHPGRPTSMSPLPGLA